jgi:hypothetical protein
MTAAREIGANSFTTLEAVVRDWAYYRRICEVQGLSWSGDSEEQGERLTRAWVSGDGRFREESVRGRSATRGSLRRRAIGRCLIQGGSQLQATSST